MTGAFALITALLLHAGFNLAAYVVEGIFLAAVLARAFGGIYLSSFVYQVLAGHAKFARQTLPWAH